jgi:tetratricopeptide (TPR) repeat protein
MPVTLLLLLATWLPLIEPQDAGPVDRAAVEAYRAGELDSARNQWLALLEEHQPPLAGDERARVLYDLGNVAARQDEWLEAVGWYTASLRLRPRDADAWANLEHARTQAGLDPADRGDLVDTLRRLMTALTPAERQWLALLALAPLALALAGEALRGSALWRRLAWAGLLLAALGAAPWIYGRATAGGDPVLVIAESGAPLRSEPRGDAAAIERAEVGAELERVDELPGWVRLELPDGTRGWTRAAAVFPLRR